MASNAAQIIGGFDSGWLLALLIVLAQPFPGEMNSEGRSGYSLGA
jgi:hypothetical protein